MKDRRARSSRSTGLGIVSLCFFLTLSTSTYGQGLDKPDPVVELARWNGLDVIQGELLVQFEEGVPEHAQLEQLLVMGNEKIATLSEGLHHIRFHQGSLDAWLDAFSQNPDVEYAEPNHVYHPSGAPNDPLWLSQWGVKKIRCSEAWNLSKGNNGFVVAVIDTGVDMDHADLDDHYAWGYDFFSGDAYPNDKSGHGTHVTGIAAAETDNGEGIAGVAYNCKYAAYRTGDQTLSTSAVVSAINDARSKGAHVLSMSFEGPANTSIQIAIINAYNAGMVCVASAGNGGDKTKLYPGAYDQVIAVASSEPDDTRSSFSTYGWWVDVAAPGSNIISTYFDGAYKSQNGTSMSCTHVSGTAVMLYSMLGGPRTKAKADKIRQAIQDSAVPVGSYVRYGRVDLLEAMLLIDPQNNPPVITGVDPPEVEALMGGTITLTGSHFATAIEVDCGGILLTPPSGFTIIGDSTITFSAPTATSLGITGVTVRNPAGKSMPDSFTYIETNPPKLQTPAFTKANENFNWDFGAGMHDGYVLYMSSDKTCFNFHGFPILSYPTTIALGNLDQAGIGNFEALVPTGLKGITLYCQIVVFDDVTGNFAGVSKVEATLIIG